MSYYLIYHPARCKTVVNGFTIYHDKFGGNEDPYIWNDKFLHSYCHITQLKNEKDQVNFWVSGNTYPYFTHLFCDCVFVIDEKIYWHENNAIVINDPVVDNNQTFDHHYRWFHQHPFKKRRRYTLKADPDRSFQPQINGGVLVDILPFLNNNGFATNYLIQNIAPRRGSKPFKLINNIGINLYQHLSNSPLKIYGRNIQHLHP